MSNTMEPINDGKSTLRLWPAWLIVGVQIVCLVLTVTPSIRNLPRFIIMMAGPLVTGVAFTIWLTAASRLRWREKLGLMLAGVAAPLVASQISDPDSPLRTAMWIYGVPLTELMIAVGLTVWAMNSRRSILAALLLSVAWGSFAFVRVDGFDGDYYAEFAWRWSPRHEDTLPELNVSAFPIAPVPSDAQAATDVNASSADSWSQYRGPDGNGATDEQIAPMDWVKNPPKELWRIAIGPGWGSFSYNNGRLFTQEQRGEKEHITCYSATDGAPVWTHADEARFTEVVSGAGPRSTPSTAGGFVYALGGSGLLTCLNEENGSLVWQRNLVSEMKAPIPMWGFSGSPLIIGDKLIIFAGGTESNGLVALDCLTGKTIWGVASSEMNYTTARLMTLCDQKLIVFCDSRGVHAIDPDSGSSVWTFKPSLWKGPAMVDPQQFSPTGLIVGLGDGVGTARLEVSRKNETWSIEESWTTTKLRPSFNDAVVLDDAVYGFNQAVFSSVSLTNGNRNWQGGRYGFGQAVLLRNAKQIIVAAENGDAVLLQATPEKLTELARMPVLNDKTWNHPVVVSGKLFLRNGKSAVCLQLNP